MLDEAVKGNHGGDRKSGDINLYNVQVDMAGDISEAPAGNGRAAGLRKLRKHAANNPEVAEVNSVNIVLGEA